ncbi:MAG: RNA polymerase sigma factor [Acidobacteriota bacterium]|nr:RNA polymerase sigma factor [Acidobacteriota bacterium]
MSFNTALEVEEPVEVFSFAKKEREPYNDPNQSEEVQLNRETVWIKAIARGELGAFEQLCRAYQRRVFVYLFRLLNDREAAEEAVDDVLHGIWKGANRFRGNSKPATWIFGIARHKALNRLGRYKPYEETLERAGELRDSGGNAETRLVSQDLVGRALGKLSREHREVIEMTFYLGLSYAEISKVMECPVSTVKTRMFHAKQRLRAILSGNKS